MKFLIQHNLINPVNLAPIKEAVKNYPHEFVGCLSDTHEIVSDEPLEGVDYIPYGSTALINVAYERKWRGAYFDYEQLNYATFLKHRTDMLNGPVMRLSELAEFADHSEPETRVFLRPKLDLKAFAGHVTTMGEIVTWIENFMKLGQPDLDVVIGKVQNISAEWRWFIVGGKIISGSMYRAHNQPRSEREDDPEVIAEAQALADIWLPFPCVVMDTALVNGEVKVIEFNGINASGFYDHDINAVMKALWEYQSN